MVIVMLDVYALLQILSARCCPAGIVMKIGFARVIAVNRMLSSRFHRMKKYLERRGQHWYD